MYRMEFHLPQKSTIIQTLILSYTNGLTIFSTTGYWRDYDSKLRERNQYTYVVDHSSLPELKELGNMIKAEAFQTFKEQQFHCNYFEIDSISDEVEASKQEVLPFKYEELKQTPNWTVV